ncbi:hypothetical protein [Yoonia sp.]|uniref:hypothetical protein n=1 Tax=Yoonia sp. TaxID=2212373 RepID=UPI002E073990|nr:hypothetical protein [Yoonia sp.]
MLHAHCKALLTNTIAMTVLLFSVAEASGQTQDIEGRYQVSWANLGGSGQYSGEVAVTRTGDALMSFFKDCFSIFRTPERFLYYGPPKEGARSEDVGEQALMRGLDTA